MTDTNDMRCPSHSMPMIGTARRRGRDRPNGTRDTDITTPRVDATLRRSSALFDDAEAVA